MAVLKETPTRKTVIRGDRTISLDTFETVIVSDEFYTTKGESLLIVRDTNICKIKLDSTTTDRIKIKTLVKCTIVPDLNRIDEDWDEISISRGACVELQNVKGIWYILSSDGVKME